MTIVWGFFTHFFPLSPKIDISTSTTYNHDYNVGISFMMLKTHQKLANFI